MIGIYFSGTGNTKYCLMKFLNEIALSVHIFSIEDKDAIDEVKKSDLIIFAYPIYFSNLPKIVRDFILDNKIFSRKKVFIITTMSLFSGDGAGCAARLFLKQNAHILGGLHLKMPDCISDVKALKKTLDQNKQLIKNTQAKINDVANKFKNNVPTQDGLGFLYHVAGLFGQRLWFYNKTRNYTDKLKINLNKCIGCGICKKLCPLKNLKIADGKAQANNKCTMCYRCINNCPKQAITLLGKTIYEQCNIEKYI